MSDTNGDGGDQVVQAENPRQFPCPSCGGKLEFHPGVQTLKCPFCQHEVDVPQVDVPVQTEDFLATLRSLQTTAETVEVNEVPCKSCGAVFPPEANVTSMRCPYCDSPVVTQGSTRKLLKPGSLLPFKIEGDQARGLFKSWIGKLWFAPNRLKHDAEHHGGLDGIYMPYWTYTCDTNSHYTGQRGDYYYVTEHYTSKDSSGKTVTKTRQVRKTRWTPVTGMVREWFHNVLVLASKSLPAKLTTALEPWDLDQLVPYADEYLSGFRAESYQVDLEQGWSSAQQQIDARIRQSVRGNIGGDEQRITSLSTRHSDIGFKHVLLPLWISAYRFNGKVYRFLVNARSGEVQGDRPWSIPKIAAAVIAVLTVLAVIVGLAAYFGS
jgi:Zn finger protein HypA/HybF involved in hydrogenase expression